MTHTFQNIQAESDTKTKQLLELSKNLQKNIFSPTFLMTSAFLFRKIAKLWIIFKNLYFFNQKSYYCI